MELVCGLGLVCIQGLAYIQVLAYTLVLEHKLVLERKLALEHKQEQSCEQELGHRKQFLRIRPRLHFLNKHQQYCKLQFVCDHQATKLGIGQPLSTHLGVHFVQSLLHCSHLVQHIHIDKQLGHLRKQDLYYKLELEHDKVLEVQQQKQQLRQQSMRWRTVIKYNAFYESRHYYIQIQFK